MVFDVENDEHEVLEAEVPSDCSTSEGRQLQHAAISELDVPNCAVAAGGSLRILVDQLKDGAGVRQFFGHNRCRPSAIEFQKPTLKFNKTV